MDVLIKILRLPALYTCDKALDLNDSLGIDLPIEDISGYVNIIPSHITCYYKEDDKTTMVELSSGNTYKVQLREEEVTDILTIGP